MTTPAPACTTRHIAQPFTGPVDSNLDSEKIQRIQNTALETAVLNGEVENARRALEKGADPDISTLDGYSMLHVAAKKGNVEILRDLLLRAKKLNPKTAIWGQTPLRTAIQEDNDPKAILECAKLLIQARAEVNIEDSYVRNTPLYAAAALGLFDTVHLLLEARADPNLGGGIAKPVIAAVKFPEIVRLLLERGARVSTPISGNYPKSGNQAIHEAAQLGESRSVKVLLEFKADPEAHNRHHQTPAHLAREELQKERTQATYKSPEVQAAYIQSFEKILAQLQDHAK